VNSAAAAFVAAGGYHHHLGFNVWGAERAYCPCRRAGLACATGRWRSKTPSNVAAVSGRIREACIATEECGGGLR
jgi:catechol 2,3-dioxygenase